MNRSLKKLTREYSAALKQYLAKQSEAQLEQAYGLGRVAVAKELGVLDIARAHQQAMSEAAHPTKNGGAAMDRAEIFFWEALSPFEVTHRGFRETNARLQEAVAALEKRNVDLERINQRLQEEISERRRTEKALRNSEEHYRELFEEARRMEENLRDLSNQIVHAQEEERKRISRELHDVVGQLLTATSVILEAVKKECGNSETLGRKATDAQNLIRETMETVHGFSRDLRPTALDELGLLPALRSHLKAFGERTGLKIEFQGDSEVEQLSSEKKTALYRVAQESLTNVARHAHAKSVRVAIRKARTGICMTISDDGKSFHRKNLRNTKRLGLLGMQERMKLVSGEFTLITEPGKGTTVQVTVPIGSSPTIGRR
jgi:signal transduction histidine kinase